MGGASAKRRVGGDLGAQLACFRRDARVGLLTWPVAFMFLKVRTQLSLAGSSLRVKPCMLQIWRSFGIVTLLAEGSKSGAI